MKQYLNKSGYGGFIMSAILDYGLESPARALLILVLSMQDRAQKKEMDKLHIQKTIRYFEYLRQERTIDFSNFKYGGVSYELHENLETLQECSLVDKIGTKHMLTEEGKKAAKELIETYGEEKLQKLRFAKLQLNDLTHDETLFFMYMLIPETQKNSTEYDRLNQRRETLIRKLFLKGRVNSTTAAKWLGVDERVFLDSL